MKYEDYNDPLYLIWNKDTSGNLVSVKVTNETYNVRYGMFVLKGIPDEGYKVLIDNMTEVKDKEELGIDEFEVDYVYGLIRMNPKINNQEIIIKEYWSRGNYYYPAHRIYWTVDELTGKVTTVHEIIEYMFTYFKKAKKEIEEMINDFRKELANEWGKILNKFEEFQTLIDKSELTKEQLEKLIIKSLSVHQDLSNIVKTAENMDFFTGVAEKTKVTIDNTEFPFAIKKEGNELGIIKNGLMVNGIFRYCSMVIKFIANGKVKNPILYNFKTKEFIKVNIEIKQGDIISIATSFYKNIASLYTKQDNEYKIIDITDKLQTNTPYIYLSVGNNTFFYDAENGEEFLDSNLFYDGRNKNEEYLNAQKFKYIQSVNGKTGKDIELTIDDIRDIDGSTTIKNLIKTTIKENNKEVVKIINNNITNGITKINAKNVELNSNKLKSLNIKDGLEELFQCVSNGKKLVGKSITDMDNNITLPANPSFEDLSQNIRKIKNGIKEFDLIKHGNLQYKIYGDVLVNNYNDVSTLSNYSLKVTNTKLDDRVIFKSQKIDFSKYKFLRVTLYDDSNLSTLFTGISNNDSLLSVNDEFTSEKYKEIFIKKFIVFSGTYVRENYDIRMMDISDINETGYFTMTLEFSKSIKDNGTNIISVQLYG